MIHTILINGNIITLDERRPSTRALAISYGRVVALGDNAEIMRLANSDAAVINLDGKTVMPGLTDAHIHWEAVARATRAVNVFEVREKNDCAGAGAGTRQRDPCWRMGGRARLGARHLARSRLPDALRPGRGRAAQSCVSQRQERSRRLGKLIGAAAGWRQRKHRRSRRRADPA